MDIESIHRLGLDRIKNIDVDATTEMFDPSTCNHTILVKLKKAVFCKNCGSINIRVRSMETKKINHASAKESNIVVLMKRRRYECEDCKKTFRDSDPLSYGTGTISYETQLKILFALKDKNKNFIQVANEFNVSKTTVTNIFDSRVNMKRRPFAQVLCVDEVYNKHCVFHHYCFFTFSPQKKEILDVLPSRNKEELCEYFLSIPREERLAVEYFSMDMFDPYRQVAKICFPNAKICADHFHVVKKICEEFNHIRIEVMKKYENQKKQNVPWYWLYKKFWRLLLKAEDQLDQERRIPLPRHHMELTEGSIVAYMLRIDDQLKRAYYLLNEYREFNATATIDDAADQLDDLIVRFKNFHCEEYLRVAKCLTNWREEIINSFNKVNNHVISNGAMERINRDVKTIIRNSFGFRDFTRFRNKVMYSINENSSFKDRNIKKSNGA